MKVNYGKTKTVVFRRGGKLKLSDKWYLDGHKIEIVPFYKYLGLIMSSSGLWYIAQKMLAAQPMKAVFALKRHISNIGDIPLNYAFKAF